MTGIEGRDSRPASFSVVDAIRFGEAVRAACIDAAQKAYERARFDGLCDEGAAEVALEAVRGVDVRRLVEEFGRNRGEE